MKKVIQAITLTIAASALFVGSAGGGSEDWQFLGEEPPGTTPKIFGKGVISTEALDLTVSISPGGKEILFTRHPRGSNQNRIYYVKFENGKWSEPALAPFALDCRESHANFTPDGKTVFFNSRRPLPEGVETDTPLNAWFVTKTADGWGEPEFFGPPVSDIRPMYVTLTGARTLYTTGCRERGIYRAVFEEGRYLPPERLPDEVNGVNWPGHPYIAPDESYLVFDSNVDDKGTKHLFVSTRRPDGSWSPAGDLTDRLGFPSGACPHVTFDGKYLFFTSGGDVWWVDATVINEVKSPGVD